LVQSSFMVFISLDEKREVIELLKLHVSPYEKIAIACSGGPDSIYLVHVLIELQKILLCEIIVIHVDHKVRSTSTQEADQLQGYVESLSLSFKLLTIKWEGAPDKREHILRDLRFNALCSYCKSENIKTILTGHQGNDQQETIIKRCLEGSSLLHLSGISSFSKREGMTLLRPLLSLHRQKILSALEERKIPYIEDQSNYDTHFLRARMRKETLPFIEKSFGKKIDRATVRLSQEALDLKEYFKKKAAPYLKEVIYSDLGVCLDLSEKKPQEKVEMRYLLQIFLSERQVTLSHSNLISLVTFLLTGEANKKVIQGETTLHIDRGRLFILNPQLFSQEKNKAIVPMPMASKGEVGLWKYKISKVEGVFPKENLGWKAVWNGYLSKIIPCKNYTVSLEGECVKVKKERKVALFLEKISPCILCEQQLMFEFLSNPLYERVSEGNNHIYVQFYRSFIDGE
jgi:tRNA(Ile)-lysidine synthase